MVILLLLTLGTVSVTSENPWIIRLPTPRIIRGQSGLSLESLWADSPHAMTMTQTNTALPSITRATLAGTSTELGAHVTTLHGKRHCFAQFRRCHEAQCRKRCDTSYTTLSQAAVGLVRLVPV